MAKTSKKNALLERIDEAMKEAQARADEWRDEGLPYADDITERDGRTWWPVEAVHAQCRMESYLSMRNVLADVREAIRRDI